MQSLIAAVEAIDDVEVFGRVRTVQGLLIEIVGPVRELRVGGRVSIETTGGGRLAAEIIGFREGHALCLPFGPLTGVRLGCRAVFQRHDGMVQPADSWLGRVIDANARPIDGKGPLLTGALAYPLQPNEPSTLSLEHAINLADAALYQAKQAGRDRAVRVAGDPGQQPHTIVRS